MVSGSSLVNQVRPTGTYQYKYMKENLHVLVLYGLQLLEFEQDEAQLHVLLPYNELGTTTGA